MDGSRRMASWKRSRSGLAEPSPEWIEASSIAIKFPAMTDGRGLSLAVLIRKRLGYRGELIARGSVHQDIVHFLARCGFDAIELPDEERLETALKWIDPHTGYYQPSVISSESPLTPLDIRDDYSVGRGVRQRVLIAQQDWRLC